MDMLLNAGRSAISAFCSPPPVLRSRAWLMLVTSVAISAADATGPREVSAAGKPRSRYWIFQVQVIEVDETGKKTLISQPKLQTTGAPAGVSIDRPDGKRFDLTIEVSDPPLLPSPLPLTPSQRDTEAIAEDDMTLRVVAIPTTNPQGIGATSAGTQLDSSANSLNPNAGGAASNPPLPASGPVRANNPAQRPTTGGRVPQPPAPIPVVTPQPTAAEPRPVKSAPARTPSPIGSASPTTGKSTPTAGTGPTSTGTSTVLAGQESTPPAEIVNSPADAKPIPQTLPSLRLPPPDEDELRSLPAAAAQLRRNASSTGTTNPRGGQDVVVPLVERLAHKVSIDAVNQSRRDVLRRLSLQAGVPIVIDPQSATAVKQQLDEAVELHAKEMELQQVIRQLIEPLQLKSAVRHELLLLALPQRLDQPVSELYVHVYPVTDFLPQNPTAEDYNALADRIRQQVLQKTWNQNQGGTIRVFESTSSLVVRQTDLGHAAVVEYLEQLRWNRDTPRWAGRTDSPAAPR